jgi:mono/diheme cytochrome c family protein
MFDYDSLIRPGYVRAVPEGAGQAGPKPMPARDAFVRRGAKIYTRCTGCHGADGKGDAANYPSLAGSAWATGPTQRFAMIVLNGLQGPTSTGKAYAAPMPPQGAGLTPEDLAAVMTYVRNSFGNEVGDVVSVAQAKTALEVSAARKRTPLPVTAEELEAEHKQELSGEPIAADALVEPGSLAPVKSN